MVASGTHRTTKEAYCAFPGVTTEFRANLHANLAVLYRSSVHSVLAQFSVRDRLDFILVKHEHNMERFLARAGRRGWLYGIRTILPGFMSGLRMLAVPRADCPSGVSRHRCGKFFRPPTALFPVLACGAWVMVQGTAMAATLSSSDFSIDRCKTLQSADVNGDGNDDLICPYDYGSAKTATFVQFSHNPSASVWTIWSAPTGTGSFAVGQCKTIQTGDVNGDGMADLICPYDYGGARTKTFVQLSSGETGSNWTSWSPLAPSGSFAVGQCRPMRTGDVDGDGKDDLICPYDYGGARTKTFVQFSSGASGSKWTDWSPLAPSGSFAVSQCKPMQTDDVDGNGKADLICTYDYSGTKSKTFVQFSNGATSSSWTAWSPETLSRDFVVDQCTIMRTGDVDGDGKADLICSYDYSGTKSRTFVQFSSGATSSGWTAWSPEAPSSAFVVEQCTIVMPDDVNADGKVDLICSDYQGDAARPTYVQLSNGLTGSDWRELASLNGSSEIEAEPTSGSPTTASANVGGNLANSIFAQPLPTPQCDGWVDTVGDMANYVAREANDMARAELNRWKDMSDLAANMGGNLLSGDFEGMGDNLIDYSNEQMVRAFVRAIKPTSMGIDLTAAVVPSGEFTEFLVDAQQTVETMGPVIAMMINPANTVKGDASEIGGDLWNMVENIDDPEEFGRAWIHWQQQWNPVGSLTYLVTESDPMVGVRKAAQRIQRQADIISTYVAPLASSGTKVAKFVRIMDKMNMGASMALQEPPARGSNIGGGKKQLFKNLLSRAIVQGEIGQFGKACFDEVLSGNGCANEFEVFNPSQLNAQKTLRLNILIARTMAEIDSAAASAHPFYTSTEIRDVRAIKVGSESDFKLYRPDVENTNCIAIGDHAEHMAPGWRAPTHLPAVCNVSTNDDWWASPIDYKLVWGDNCSGGDDLSIWQPVCPTGYSAMGFVASGESSYRPSPDRIACLKNDPGIFQWADGNEARLRKIATDRGSGAKWDVTLMTRDFAGIPLMYATAGYPTVNQSYLADIDVPIAQGIPGPDGVFSNMMTFEVTTSRISHASSDDPAWAVLHNATGDTHRVLLDNPSLNDRESGNSDTYDVYRPAAFGKVTSFELDSAGDDGWNFSSVALKQVSKSLQVETMSFSGGDDYSTHTGQAIHCIGGSCLNSGPGCGSSVAGQCSFPKEQAQALCSAHPQCVALTCNPNRDDCQARRHNTLSAAGGYTAYIGGRWLDGFDGPHVQQFPPQRLLSAGKAYSLQQNADTGGGQLGFLNNSGDQVLTTGQQGYGALHAGQRWLFEPVKCEHALGAGSSNCYRILQQSPNKYLDAYESVPGFGCDSDCRVVTRARQNNLSQVWIVRRRGRGPEGGANAYTVQHAVNGRYLDGYEYGNAVTRSRQHDDSQTWIIREANWK